ncbi:MAG TPA: polyprenol monophosphomannose synthase [Micromonospora sp.]|nr:polyprenol monophosphomannose synthase [Micromonospora sp.]
MAGEERRTGHAGVGRVLVVIPTYNEADNIRTITERIHRAAPAVDILVVDDDSPDGTGEIAQQLAATDRRIQVLPRPGKQGLGAAYVAGFGWAREHGYDAVVEMDADGSHAPEELPRLLQAARHADVVLGSRWMPGARVVNSPWHRLLLSRAGNLYTRLALGMRVRDATGGYRVYRTPVLAAINCGAVASQGYSFQVELCHRAHRAGFRIVEVPITFSERQGGVSKMNALIIGEALWRVTIWGMQDRRAALRRAVSGPVDRYARWP